MKKNLYYYSFIITLYMFVFQFALMQVSSVFKYWDEIYALALPVLLIIKRPWRNGIQRDDLKILFLCIALILIGLLSNIIFRYQIITATIKDVLLCMKFFMGIYSTCLLFQNFDFEYYKNDIGKHTKMIILSLFVLLIIDYVFQIFPCYEIRFGIRSEQLFFGHATALASVAFFLLLMLMIVYESKITDNICIILAMILVLSSLRAKAFGIVVIFVYLFFCIVVFKKKFYIKHILMLVPLIMLIGWKQIYAYFFSAESLTMARGAIFYNAFQIMRDYFPIGTGFGTYASAPSGEAYSVIYPMYDLDKVWGLSRDWPAFVSDTFWPMIFGQFGVLGTIVYVRIISLIWKKVSKVSYYNKSLYIASIGALMYLFVSSTSESAFVNPLSLPLALIIGIGYIGYNRYEGNDRFGIKSRRIYNIDGVGEDKYDS